MAHREFYPKDSTNIRMLAFDGKHLTVRFRNASPSRAVYVYQDVPQEIWDQLVTAESVGSSFGKLVRKHPDRFPFRKLSRRPVARTA